MKHILLIFSVLVLAVCLETVQAGIFELYGGLDVHYTWDDNILLLSDEEISESGEEAEDEIIQIHPYLRLLNETSRTSTWLHFDFYKEWYQIDHPELDRTDYSYFDLMLKSIWDATDRVSIGLMDHYMDSLYNIEDAEIAEHRDDYWSNSFQPTVLYHLDDNLNITLRGSYDCRDYDEPPLLFEGYVGFADWEQMGIRLSTLIELNTHTSFLADGEFWTRDYDVDAISEFADYDGMSLSFGVEQGLYGDRLTLTAKGMYERRDYESTSNTFDSKTSYDNFGGSVDLSMMVSALTRVNLQGFSRFYTSERFVNAFYRDTGARFDMTTLITNRVELGLLFRYSKFDYENVDEEWSDDFVRAGVTLAYRATEWMSIRTMYQWAERDSYYDLQDFENNIATVYIHFFTNLLR
ncbi:MAG TPA: outer membrane beta-barrel protein [bacterium]|nr:outer membrane beta-barrel protein [bacterium]